MKRAIVLVLDGCGAGPAPDAPLFGDYDAPATVLNVWNRVGGFEAPHLAACGFLAACGIDAPRPPLPHGLGSRFGRLRELSMGKDSVTGHWEMMGIVTERPFPTYPDGFPPDLVAEFERRIGRSILGNVASSGTKILEELGAQHVASGKPILYTSADSVFQVACHEAVVPVEELYRYCRIARELLVPPHDIQRVIARPFEGDAEGGWRRTERRKDFPLTAPANLVDQIGDVYGIGVVPELFDGRGFRPLPRTQSNPEHARALDTAWESDARFIWANFEDFDMLYGHRNDPEGFARCLEEFDRWLGPWLLRLREEDMLILTSDHGNDPTSASTDHSREYVPLCVIRPGGADGPFADVDGMSLVGITVAQHLGLRVTEIADQLRL